MVSGRSWVQLLVTELAVLIALTRAEVVSLEGTAPLERGPGIRPNRGKQER